MKNYRKTVVGVVYQGKEFLLVEKPHWGNWWDFVQGGVNDRESLENALVRELKEELGTNKFGKPVYTNITQRRLFSPEALKHYSDRGFIGKELFYFVVPFIGDRSEILLGDDLSDKKWCSETELIHFLYKEQVEEGKQVIQFMKFNKLI